MVTDSNNSISMSRPSRKRPPDPEPPPESEAEREDVVRPKVSPNMCTYVCLWSLTYTFVHNQVMICSSCLRVFSTRASWGCHAAHGCISKDGRECEYVVQERRHITRAMPLGSQVRVSRGTHLHSFAHSCTYLSIFVYCSVCAHVCTNSLL